MLVISTDAYAGLIIGVASTINKTTITIIKATETAPNIITINRDILRSLSVKTLALTR
jgi:hypothetical protein